VSDLPLGAMDIASALTELAQLDRATLAHRWESAFDVPPPRGCQATLLRLALAWHLQVQALGPAGARTSRQAAQSVKKAAVGSAQLAPGTRLMREWQGQTHHVTVVQGAFEYDGRAWRSLSAIARSITGTAWSGPVFFGLK
jgi:hypothetical protein